MTKENIEEIRVLENYKLPKNTKIEGYTSIQLRPIWYWRIKKFALIAQAKSRFQREVVGIEENTSSKSK